MAADAVLSVAVVAEVEQFKSGFSQLGVSIGDLQRKILAYKDIVANSLDTRVIAKYNAMIEVTSAELNKLNSIGKKGFDGLGNAVLASGQKIAKGSNQANLALTDFGRLAQDAPYGFMGWANNINPAFESLNRLVAETGSFKGALKSLGSSLVGVGGIGLAFSVVSTGILLYQEYQRKANKEIENAKKSTDEYAKTLNSVNQASLVGSQNTQGDIIKLQTLYAITQDVTVSLKQRKEAVDQLQSQYPAYFKNINDEAFLAGAAKKAYDLLTVSIIATGKARAAESLISENSKKVLENDQKLIDIRARRLIIDRELAATNNKKLDGGSEESLQGQLAQIDARRNRLQEERNEGIRIANELSGDSYKLNQDNLQLTKSIIDEVKKGADVSGGVGDLKEVKKSSSIDVITGNLEKIRDLIKRNNDDILTDNLKADEKEITAIQIKYENQAKEVNNAAKAALKQKGITKEQILKIQLEQGNALAMLQKQSEQESAAVVQKYGDIRLKTYQDNLKNIEQLVRDNQVAILKASQNSPFGGEIEEVKQDIIKLDRLYEEKLLTFEDYQAEYASLLDKGEALKSLENFNMKLTEALERGSEGLLEGLATGMAGLVNGTMSMADVGGALLAVIGDISIQLGKAAIGIGIGMKAIKESFKNPFTAVAAGVALIAMGSIIKRAGQIPEGRGSGSDSGPAPRKIPGFAKGVTNFSGGLAIVGEDGPELVNLPAGSDVIPNNRIGQISQGSQNIVVTGYSRISMGEFVTEFKRVDKLNGRTS